MAWWNGLDDAFPEAPRARALKPYRLQGGDWRGGRITAVDTNTITVSVRAEQSYEQSYVVSKTLYTHAAVGNACACRIGNLGPAVAIANYLITEIRDAHFAGEEHTAARPNWGAVGYELTNESPYWEQ